MASVSIDGKGRKIQFTGLDRRRKTIRLGKMDRKSADSIARHVETLLASKISGQPIRQETASWLAELPPLLYDRLAKVDLVSKQQTTSLGAYLDDFIELQKPTAAINTIKNLGQAKKRLIAYFGNDCPIRSIGTLEAEKWATDLAKKYALATAGRTIKRARQFFKSAMKQKLVTENPFLEVKASGKVNKERQVHVSREVIGKVIEAAPDAEWRLIIILSRYGGLRCPSEHMALKWSDIDWARNRFRVNSPKTGERWVPIFPELRPYLEECFEQATDGAVYVINRYRRGSGNLRTGFRRIIQRAGESIWPKLFHNLRASRQTELAAEFPIHVVCTWIGNTAAIATKHYLTVREEDFGKATGDMKKGGADSGAQVAQKAAQQVAAPKRTNLHKKTQPHGKHEVVPTVAGGCNSLQDAPVPPRGLEPLS